MSNDIYLPYDARLKNDLAKARQSIADLRSIIATLEARLEAARFEVPDGWVLVPIKLTSEMRRELIYGSYDGDVSANWAALLELAPKYEEPKE